MSKKKKKKNDENYLQCIHLLPNNVSNYCSIIIQIMFRCPENEWNGIWHMDYTAF